MFEETKAAVNYILRLGKHEGIAISPMKLQKLLYYSHGWHLALLEKPLLKEPIEAWQWGPVIPSVYHDFKRYGSQPIAEVAYAVDSDCVLEDLSKSVIDGVWNVYKKFTAVQLSNMTHDEHGPWHTVWNSKVEGQDICSADIPNDKIKQYFKILAEAGE